MEIRIKLSSEEVEALCVSRCQGISPAPAGKRWDVRLTTYIGAVCELQDMPDLIELEEEASVPKELTPVVPSAIEIPAADLCADGYAERRADETEVLF